MKDKEQSRSNVVKQALSQVTSIDEQEESEEIDRDGYEQINTSAFSRATVGHTLASEFQGLIFVADDQHINLEIIKQHMNTLDLEDKCKYFING